MMNPKFGRSLRNHFDDWRDGIRTGIQLNRSWTFSVNPLFILSISHKGHEDFQTQINKKKEVNMETILISIGLGIIIGIITVFFFVINKIL